MSTPVDLIRPILQAISTAFPHKDTQDALAALAELERERDALRAGLERLTRLYEDEHDLCERPMWLQCLIARPTRKGGE